MGDVIQFPTRAGYVEQPVVSVLGDGSLVYQGDVDEASAFVWEAVGAQVQAAWMETEIPRLRKQIALMKMALDEFAPDWKQRLREQARIEKDNGRNRA